MPSVVRLVAALLLLLPLGVRAADDDATSHRSFEDVEQWRRVFDDPARDAWQKPRELVAALGIRPGPDRAEPTEALRDVPIVSNLRHAALLETARAALDRALDNLRAAGEQASEEIVIADLADARAAFEDITGRRTAEDVLRHIFANFCVGK